MNNFEDIYETLIGLREPEAAVPGVESIAVKGTRYSEAWQELMDARIRLAERFGIDFEDADLERIMDAVAVIEREAACAIFHQRVTCGSIGGHIA